MEVGNGKLNKAKTWQFKQNGQHDIMFSTKQDLPHKPNDYATISLAIDCVDVEMESA